MDFKSLLILVLVMLAALYTGVDGAYKYINYKFPVLYTEINDNLTGNLTAVAPIISMPENSEPKENASETVSSGGTAPVMGNETAVVKITDRFISPYGANTSYNNVFLKNNTGLTIDLPSLLKQRLNFKVEKNSSPQVLIVHTHSTESYMTQDRDYYTESDFSRRLDTNQNMVHIGEIFAEKLQNAGIGVIHDKTLHDHPSYTGSYTRSAETVNKHLSENPSIKIVIDIHRDAITSEDKTKTRPVLQFGGENTAQVMLVMGSETGGITNFPKWKENLAFAVKYQQTLEVMYPGIARAITLNSAKYNQNLTVGSILLEVGSEANTFSEAESAAEKSATALVGLLNTLK